MKEKTPQTPTSTEEDSIEAGEREKQPPRLDNTMQTEFQTRKMRGRLTREDQRRLGDVLQRVYDDVLKQGVPDRFKTLIDQLGQNEDFGQEASGGSNGHMGSSSPGSAHGVQARGSDKSKDES
jgi:hypothetical protein